MRQMGVSRWQVEGKWADTSYRIELNIYYLKEGGRKRRERERKKEERRERRETEKGPRETCDKRGQPESKMAGECKGHQEWAWLVS